jgi:virginiamycin B lyase
MRALGVATGVFGVLVSSSAIAADARVVVHLFSAPNAGGAVQMARTGSGEIWFPQPNDDSLARVNADGSLTERNLPTSSSRPLAISRDDFSSGRIVFSEVGSNRIGVFDENFALTEYAVPTAASNPRGVIAGGNTVWFTEYDGNRIGRFTLGVPSSMVEFSIPTFASGPLGIAVGPDAAVWFTENLANKIGRLDSSGTITEFFVPTADSGPTSIVAGFDGNADVLYFTEARGNKIGKISTTGQITEYAIPSPNSSPTEIVWDFSEQALWFTERTGGRLGWMSNGGAFHEFTLPGTARPESLVLDYGHGIFGPLSVWYLDGTNRRVGRLSDNHIFAVGARREGTVDTEFELSNSGGTDVNARIGWPYRGVCPTLCPLTSIDVVVPRRGKVEPLASELPESEGQRFFYVTGIEPEISDVPPTRAWIVDEDRPDFRLEIPLVSYWTIATMQPPLPRGVNGPQPFLDFPARRRPGFRTSLILAAIEAEGSEDLELEIEAFDAGNHVVGSMDVAIPQASVLVLDQVLSDMGIFGDFDGKLRVTRSPRSGLFWGVTEIYEGGELTRLLPPGSTLEPPVDCDFGPALCNGHRGTRAIVRQAP